MQVHIQVRGSAFKRNLFQHRPFLPRLHCQHDFAHEVGHQHVFGRVQIVVVAAAEGGAAHVFALAGGEDVEDALLDVGGILHDAGGMGCGGELPVAGARGHRRGLGGVGIGIVAGILSAVFENVL